MVEDKDWIPDYLPWCALCGINQRQFHRSISERLCSDPWIAERGILGFEKRWFQLSFMHTHTHTHARAHGFIIRLMKSLCLWLVQLMAYGQFT